MTIAELIQALQKFPQYTPVHLDRRNTPPDGRTEVHHVVWHGGYVQLSK